MKETVSSPGMESPIVHAAEEHMKVIRERMKKSVASAPGVRRADRRELPWKQFHQLHSVSAGLTRGGT